MTPSVLDLETTVASAAAHGPSELRHIDYLDGWRGLAIALVLQAHFFSLPGINRSGRLGVDVFFVLSGLLMSRILFVKRVPLDVFYKRRISRIFPVFLLYVAAVYGAAYWLGREERHNIFWTITFLRTYLPVGSDSFLADIPILQLWSLNVEEHCYIFLGLLTLVAPLKGREGPVLLLVGAASIAIHFAYRALPAIAPISCEARTEAAAGHLLVSAGYYLVRRRAVPFVRPWMPLAAASGAAACHADIAPWWLTVILSPLLLAFAVNHLSESPLWFRSALAWPLLRLLGVWSYSIYLWHGPFASHDYFGHNGNVASCAAGVAAGVASFYLFENPLRTWMNKVW
jgi:peptidoglycan/LPS O-acetylase OafA/YrhL